MLLVLDLTKVRPWGEEILSADTIGKLIFPFSVFTGKEAVCVSSTLTPKKLSFLLLPVTVGSCPCAVPSCVAQP